MPAPPDHKRIARMAASAFGGVPRVTRHHDPGGVACVDLLTSFDQPQRGLTSFATLGLSDSPIVKADGTELAVRAEFVGACASRFERFAGVMTGAAFRVIDTREFCAPGVVFPGVVAAEYPDSPMKHLMFVPPFLWGDFSTLKLPQKTVAWLMVIPLSDRELEYARAEGASRLEELLEAREIDLFDLYRPSVL